MLKDVMISSPNILTLALLTQQPGSKYPVANEHPLAQLAN